MEPQKESPNLLGEGTGQYNNTLNERKDTENNDMNPVFDFDKFSIGMEETISNTQTQVSRFPVDIFPDAIQEIIRGTNEALNYPIDFIGGALLYAVSVAIGNTHKIEIAREYNQNAVLYLAIVGQAGTNKSQPLSFALKPIEERDDLNFQKYEKEKREYDNAVGLSKKEKQSQGYEAPVKPFWEQLLVTDFTPEALLDVHKFNKRGIGVYTDELASWFKNFNRYSSGSEEQFWLSVWSGKPIRINRKTTDPIYLPLPFISVAGTIQPGVLNELAKDRTENGFIDRLLFVVPENIKREYWSEVEISPLIITNWKRIVSTVLDLSPQLNEMQSPQPEFLRFTPEAKALMYSWQKETVDISNSHGSFNGIYAKIELYALRFALILEMMRFACGQSDKRTIGIESVKGAIKLVEYFKDSAVKVRSFISNDSPLDKLPTDKQAVYTSLPELFKTSEGVQIAESMGFAERSFKRLLNKRGLFRRVSRGEYEKLY